MSTNADFSSIPTLDYSLLSSPLQRGSFIAQLRNALINSGFLYLSNHPVSQTDIDLLISYLPKFFALPPEAKEKMDLIHSEHYLGYSLLGAERTKGAVDQREQFDFGTKLECRWKKGDPDYLRLWGPSQWPDEELIPGFREVVERYFDQIEALSYKFSSLAAEAFGLGPDGLAPFYSALMQHHCKLVHYPVVKGASGHAHGVGPHYDHGFLTFLLQASPHRGLQIQNQAGDWIDAPPIPGTLVINVGKALEFVTGGLAKASSHRVLSPNGTTPRYSVPFFHNVRLDVRLADQILTFPPEIAKLRDERGLASAIDSVNFTEFDREFAGTVYLIGRVKSHPDVAERYYPELFKQIFPNGYSVKGSAR